MPIVNCPWQACRFYSNNSIHDFNGICTKKDDEEITLVNQEDEKEGANCTSFEWPEAALHINP